MKSLQVFIKQKKHKPPFAIRFLGNLPEKQSVTLEGAIRQNPMTSINNSRRQLLEEKMHLLYEQDDLETRVEEKLRIKAIFFWRPNSIWAPGVQNSVLRIFATERCRV